MIPPQLNHDSPPLFEVRCYILNLREKQPYCCLGVFILCRLRQPDRGFVRRACHVSTRRLNAHPLNIERTNVIAA
jgi:hypothetical protein